MSTINEISKRLEPIRDLLKPEFRDKYKFTFIARDPDNPKGSILVSEDTTEGIRDALERLDNEGTPL